MPTYRDHMALTEECEYFDLLTDDQKHRARLVVAGNSIDAADANDLMLMLGIHPSQDEEGVPRPILPRFNTALTNPKGRHG